MLIGAEDDLIVPVGGLKLIAERTQSPWMIVYKNAGHGVLEQYRDSILGNIDNFLNWAAMYGDEEE